MSRESLPLDLLAQQPRINRLYTHLTLCYGLRDDERTATTQTLSNACNTLSDVLPWSAGEVVYDGTSFNIRCGGKAIQLVLKQVEKPTFHDFKAARFPFSMIHESDYAPCKTVATDDASTAALPVFVVQATYVEGGLLLTFAGQHGAMDIVGLGQLMYLFAKLCRNDLLTESELDVANGERWTDLSGVGGDSPLHSLIHEVQTPHRRTASLIQTPESVGLGNEPVPVTNDFRPHQTDEGMSAPKIENAPCSPLHQLVWAYFAFPKSSLNSLKGKASENLVDGTFVSTDDVLTAFIWLSITRVRAQMTLDRQSSFTTLSRQVDMRRYLSLAPTYPGLMVQETRHTISVDTLVHQSFGSIAVQLRSALDSSLLTERFHEKIQSMIASDSQNKGRDIPPLEVRLSSWSKLSCYDHDLGFGKPICVRRPAFSDGARDGLVYFLPKEPDDSVTVALCLEDVDLRMLREDAEFAEFATYVG